MLHLCSKSLPARLQLSHALGLAKTRQFSMLLIFTLFVTQIYDTYDRQFAQYFSLPFLTPKEGNRGYATLSGCAAAR